MAETKKEKKKLGLSTKILLSLLAGAVTGVLIHYVMPVVISGCSFRNALTKLFLDGITGEPSTRTTMISPVVNPRRIST